MISFHPETSRDDCSVLCNAVEACLSFEYSPTQNTCQLNDGRNYRNGCNGAALGLDFYARVDSMFCLNNKDRFSTATIREQNMVREIQRS